MLQSAFAAEWTVLEVKTLPTSTPQRMEVRQQRKRYIAYTILSTCAVNNCPPADEIEPQAEVRPAIRSHDSAHVAHSSAQLVIAPPPICRQDSSQARQMAAHVLQVSTCAADFLRRKLALV